MKTGWPGHDPRPHQLLRESPSPPSRSDSHHRSRRSRSRSPDVSSRSRNDDHRRRSRDSPDSERRSSHKTKSSSEKDSSPSKKVRRHRETGGYSPLREGSGSGYTRSSDYAPLSGANKSIISDNSRWNRSERGESDLSRSGVDIPKRNAKKYYEFIDTSEQPSDTNGLVLTKYSSAHRGIHAMSPIGYPQPGVPLMERNINMDVDNEGRSFSRASTSFTTPGAGRSTTSLISQLTKVHLRLLDNRKLYNEESLKLEAFESLAAQFDLPHMLTSSLPTAQAMGVHSESLATDLLSSIDPSNHHVGREISASVDTNKDSQKRGNLSPSPQATPVITPQEHEHPPNASSSTPTEYSNLASSANGGHDTIDKTKDQSEPPKVHQAFLDTLSSVRQKQKKMERRVHEDFEEMAEILERIWKSTIEAKAAEKSATVKGTETGNWMDNDCIQARDLDSDRPRSSTRDPGSAMRSTTSVSKPQAGGDDSVTSTDADGKVLKKMRRVSFHDEIGASEQEKEMLRCLEEKIVGLEKKLVRFSQVEKENMKMKAELKTQKEALEMIRATVEVQTGIIAGIAGSQTDSPRMYVKGTDDIAASAATD